IQVLKAEDSSSPAGSADKIPDSDRCLSSRVALCQHLRDDCTAPLSTSTAICRKGGKKMGPVASGGGLCFSADLCRESVHGIISVCDSFDSQVSSPTHVIQSLLHDNVSG